MGIDNFNIPLMNKDSNEKGDKKIDNGLKKKELEEKYGAQLHENSDIPPDIEGKWLNNIEVFEEQFLNAKTTSVYNYLDNLSYIKLSDLDPKEISAELEHNLTVRQNSGVSLGTLCEVEEEVLYRFITEELFNEEMDDTKVLGMMSCFTYEKNYPNAKWDIENAIDCFFRFTMGKMENIGVDGYDLLSIDTEKYENAKGEELKEQKEISIAPTINIRNIEGKLSLLLAIIIGHKKSELYMNKARFILLIKKLLDNNFLHSCFNSVV